MVNWASVISSSVTLEAEQPEPHPNQDSTCENALPTKVTSNRSAPCADVSRCAQCGEPEKSGSVVVPFGTAASGHTWLHPECWKDWQGKGRGNAHQALATTRLYAPSDFANEANYRDDL